MRVIVKILLTLVLLLALGTAGFAVTRPQLARTVLVPLSSMQELERGLYVDAQLPEAQRQQLRSDLAGARSRVQALFGSPVAAHPTIIASGDATIAAQYGASAGQAYYTAIGVYLVLGPEGMNIDVMAHELTHAELRARTGRKVPAWFDEGLAATQDRRLDDQEQDWMDKTQGGNDVPLLAEMESYEGFVAVLHRGGTALGYLTARHEVQRWLGAVGEAGLSEMVEALRARADFAESYQQIEAKHRPL